MGRRRARRHSNAKGLGGGLPSWRLPRHGEGWHRHDAGSHGSTFGGNPLAMAVGNAVLDVVLAPGFLDHVAAMGLRLKRRLAGSRTEHNGVIEEVRGQGLMLGLKSKVPNQALLQSLAAQRVLHGAGRRQCRASFATAHRQRNRDQQGLHQNQYQLCGAQYWRASRPEKSL